MALKNILVSYNALGASDAALAVAALMARKYDAHLTGLLSWGPSRISAALGPWVTTELLDSIRIEEARRRTEIAEAFAAAAADLTHERPGKVHFMDLGGDADESLMEAARVYDIVVMGQHESSAETAHIAPHPDVIALRSGRPVLIVPQGYGADRLVERAVLAWDGGRAAARAMADAMILLESKSHVTVFAAGDAEQTRRREGRDVVDHLARHGVRTDWRPVAAPAGGIARALLQTVEDAKAGLLVMGAYERSKFAEDLVGGVTKSVLAEAQVPVLMSH
ncbi:MAG: universal stress protein [Pseudomonadota bacterium]